MDARGEGTIVNDDAADDAPEVAGTFPVNGATDFPIDSNLTVTFSEPVNVTPAGSRWPARPVGHVATTFSGGPTTFTLDPGVTLVHGETCTLTVLANQVSDQDGNDPPDNMVLDFVVGFTPYDVCAATTPHLRDSGQSGSSTADPRHRHHQGCRGRRFRRHRRGIRFLPPGPDR